MTKCMTREAECGKKEKKKRVECDRKTVTLKLGSAAAAACENKM